jgi:hypothetical protein
MALGAGAVQSTLTTAVARPVGGSAYPVTAVRAGLSRCPQPTERQAGGTAARFPSNA